jgi:iron(III) transport system substrate-binding protein
MLMRVYARLSRCTIRIAVDVIYDKGWSSGLGFQQEKPAQGEIAMSMRQFMRPALHALTALALLTVATMFAQPARADGNLVVYCTVQEEWCRLMVTAFERDTGIKVSMTRKSAGEYYAQIKAEAANPRGDIWWGGTGDPHLQAAEEGLTVEYESPMNKELQPWALKQWQASKKRTIGVYAGALGYTYNTDLMKKKGGAEPKCWSDLLDARFKDDVQVADPNASGTSWTMLATIVQLMGEDKGFDFLKKMHKNVNQYTKSGAAPAKAVSLGETAIGIVFQHDAVVYAVQGAPMKIVSPCEGTGYEIGSMSIIKGAKNLDNAKKWYDWALTSAAQSIGPQNKVSFQVPSNKGAFSPPQAPKLSEIKLIDYDFAKYGSSEVRKRLLSKWDNEVKNLPK